MSCPFPAAGDSRVRCSKALSPGLPVWFVLLVILALPLPDASAAPGNLDLSFNASLEPGAVALAADGAGRILAGGDFTKANGQPAGRMVRFRTDGSRDPGFAFLADADVYSIAVQDEGTVTIGGRFTTVNGLPFNRFARLMPDGSPQTGFNLDVGIGFGLHCQALLPDGRMVLAGEFSSAGGLVRRNIARLNGHLVDPVFNPDANSGIMTAAVADDGRVLVGGLFGSIGGSISTHRAAVLDANGVSTRVYTGTITSFVDAAAFQPDGKILLGGSFSIVNAGSVRANFARFNPGGTLDAVFNPDVNGPVTVLLLQTDGKIIIGGSFTEVQSIPRNRLARLLPDGTLDLDFNPNAEGRIDSGLLEADGKVIVSGTFSFMGGLQRDRIARLRNDPATQSLTVESATRLKWLRGGASPETYLTTFEVSAGDGQPWHFIGRGRRIAGGWELTGLDLPAFGLLRARARYASGKGNGSSSIAETIIPFTVADVAP